MWGNIGISIGDHPAKTGGGWQWFTNYCAAGRARYIPRLVGTVRPKPSRRRLAPPPDRFVLCRRREALPHSRFRPGPRSFRLVSTVPKVLNRRQVPRILGTRKHSLSARQEDASLCRFLATKVDTEVPDYKKYTM